MSGYYKLVLKQSQATWKPGWKDTLGLQEVQRLHCLKRREIKFPGKTQQGIYLVWESLGNSPLLVLFTLRKESRYTARYWFSATVVRCQRNSKTEFQVAIWCGPGRYYLQQVRRPVVKDVEILGWEGRQSSGESKASLVTEVRMLFLERCQDESWGGPSRPEYLSTWIK